MHPTRVHCLAVVHKDMDSLGYVNGVPTYQHAL
jgi:hypothetical protein